MGTEEKNSGSKRHWDLLISLLISVLVVPLAAIFIWDPLSDWWRDRRSSADDYSTIPAIAIVVDTDEEDSPIIVAINQVQQMNLNGILSADVEEMMEAMYHQLLDASISASYTDLIVNELLDRLEQSDEVTQEIMNASVAVALASIPFSVLGMPANQLAVTNPKNGAVITGRAQYQLGEHIRVYAEPGRDIGQSGVFGTVDELTIRRILRSLGLNPDFASGGGLQDDLFFIRYWTNQVISVSNSHLVKGTWRGETGIQTVHASDGATINIGAGQWRIVCFWFTPGYVETQRQTLISEFNGETDDPICDLPEDDYPLVATSILDELGLPASEIVDAGFAEDGTIFFIEINLYSLVTITSSEVINATWPRPSQAVENNTYRQQRVTVTPNENGRVIAGDEDEYRLVTFRFEPSIFHRHNS